MLEVGLSLSSALGFGVSSVFARLGLQYMRPTTGVLVSLAVGTVATMAIALSLHLREVLQLPRWLSPGSSWRGHSTSRWAAS